ncbi:Alpha/Beta hydrolase protein [Chiua virens]|nr:Alpha/Beta hydrolase protein [Chiua virens]
MLYSGPPLAHKELSELPVLDSAHFLPSKTATVIRANYLVRNHEHDTKQIVAKTFTLSEHILSATIAMHASDVKGSAVSRSGNHQAILRESLATRRVEIWSDLRLIASIDVSKTHGPFLTDAVFQSISFSPSETAIIYAAEANPETADDLRYDPYPKHRYNPHFGESYSGTRRPTLFMARWRDQVLSKNIPAVEISLPRSDGVIFGQAIFATEKRIFATGFRKNEDGQPTSIWEIKAAENSVSEDHPNQYYPAFEIKVPGRSCRSPRVFLDKNGLPRQLFWLSNPLGGVHASSTSLHVRDLVGDSGDRILVDNVSDPVNGGFPGLYDCNLLPDPFIYNPTPSILIQTTWGSMVTVVSVDIKTGLLTHERSQLGGNPLDSWSLLATDGSSQMLCSQSSLTTPLKLVLLTLNDSREWVSRVLESSVVSPQVQEKLDDLILSVIHIPDRYPVETIVLQSKKAMETGAPKPYCITFPHGGPHSVYTTSFLPLVTALALEGYTLSMPNYTGTLGYGDKYIQKLVSQIGSLDTSDCVAAVEELIKRGISDRDKQLVFGGSHGGFITGNLIGQHPDLFKAAVMINPVTSAGEFSSSDIPDWPFAEAGLAYMSSTGVTPEAYKTFYDASPMAHVGNVRTPVLLILGGSDLRVPPTQGKTYFHALKERGVPTEMLMFPGEGHSFEGVEALRVTYASIRDWFGVHTGREVDKFGTEARLIR